MEAAIRQAQFIVSIVFLILAVSSAITRYWYTAAFWGILALLMGAGHMYASVRAEK